MSNPPGILASMVSSTIPFLPRRAGVTSSVVPVLARNVVSCRLDLHIHYMYKYIRCEYIRPKYMEKNYVVDDTKEI
jgi:hypothetical protein